MTIKDLHFCPEDGWYGDAMPLYVDGVYHIYYTKLNKDKPMSWGHVYTTDFVEYTVCPDPFPAGTHLTPYNTGCVYYKDGKYYAFFAGQESDEQFAIYVCESDDGISFDYPGRLCFKRTAEYRQDDTWRDPQVMYDAKCGVYRMVFCAKLPQKGTPNCYPGVVGQAVSKDFVNWECLPPLKLHGVATSIECPDLFWQDGRYYLGYYWHETRFRSALSLDGDWERGDVISPDHFDFMAAKQLCDGQRRLLFAWLPRKNCDCSERIWGGNMLLPRELYFDGLTPKTKFAKELDNVFSHKDESLSPDKAVICDNEANATKDGFAFNAVGCGATVCYPEIDDVSRIKFDFTLDNKNSCLFVTLGAHKAYTTDTEYLDMGYDLMFDAAEGMLRLREHYVWDQRGDIAVIPCVIKPGQKINVDIVYDKDILEVNVGKAQSLVCRLMKPSHGGLAITALDAKATVSGFEVFTR